MLTMCGGDTVCIAAVEKYEAACFNDNYHMSRSSQGVKMDELVACVNEKAGAKLFVSVPRWL